MLRMAQPAFLDTPAHGCRRQCLPVCFKPFAEIACDQFQMLANGSLPRPGLNRAMPADPSNKSLDPHAGLSSSHPGQEKRHKTGGGLSAHVSREFLDFLVLVG